MDTSVFTIKSVSVFEFNEAAAEFRGLVDNQADIEKSPKAQQICRDWVADLWLKPINQKSTVNLRFQKPALGVEWPTQTALWKIAQNIDVRASAELISRAMAESGWSGRYVLAIVGFAYGPVNFSALILITPATGQTVAVGEGNILDELPNIYNRRMEKAVLYPYYINVDKQVYIDEAKVYQRESVADFFPNCLRLELKPSPEQAVEEALLLAYSNTDLELVRANGAKEFALTVSEVARELHSDVDPNIARIAVSVDNISVVAKLEEWKMGLLDIINLGEGQWRVSVAGHNLQVRVGNSIIELPYVCRREGEGHGADR